MNDYQKGIAAERKRVAQIVKNEIDRLSHLLLMHPNASNAPHVHTFITKSLCTIQTRIVSGPKGRMPSEKERERPADFLDDVAAMQAMMDELDRNPFED